MPPNMKRNPRPIFPLIMVGIGLLLLAVLAIVLLRGGSPGTTNNAASSTASINEGNYPDVPRVSLLDAKSVYDNQTALFVDVRSKESYDASHIPGAISIPLNDIPNRIDELDPNAWIITYCT